MNISQFKFGRTTVRNGLWILALALLGWLGAPTVKAEDIYVQGTVRGANGAGVAGVKVEWFWDTDLYVGPFYVGNGNSGGFSQVTTDGSGNYFGVASLPNYTLSFTHVYVRLVAGQPGFAVEPTYYQGMPNGFRGDFLVAQLDSASVPAVSTIQNANSDLTTVTANIAGTVTPNLAYQPRWTFGYGTDPNLGSTTLNPATPLAPGSAGDFTASGHNAGTAGGQYGSMPSAAYFGTTGDFTIEAWVYEKSYANWSRLIDFGNGAGSDNIVFALSEGTSGFPRFDVYNAGTVGSSVRSVIPVPLNQWVHLAAVKSGTTVLIYMNGTEVGRSSVSAHQRNITRNNNYIGKSNWSGDAKADAYFDDIRIWDVSRSQANITAGRFQNLSGNNSMVANWRFDESFGSTQFLDSASYLGSQNGTAYYPWDLASNSPRTDDSINAPGLPPSPYSISATLGGLIPDTTYYYRAQVTSTPGNANGAIRSFTTKIGTPTMTVGNVTVNEDSGTFNLPITGIGDGDSNLAATYKLEIIVSDPTKVDLVAPAASTRTRYQRITGDYSWAEAKRDAERRGGHLATITSSAENALVAAAAGGNRVWLGSTDEVTEGVYAWVTGENFSYSNWYDGEPNNSNNEDYIAMYENGQWNDYPASARLGAYVLEYEDPTPATAVYSAVSLAAGTSSYTAQFNTRFNVNGNTTVLVRLIADYGNGKAAKVESTVTLTVTAVDDGPSIGMGSIMGFQQTTSDYLTLPAANYFNGSAFTVESWVYLRSRTGWEPLFDLGNGVSSDNIVGSLSHPTSGKPVFGFYPKNGTATTITAADQLPLDTWTHIAFVYDGTTAFIYVDGALKASGAMPAPANINRTSNFIARDNWTTDGFMYGRISEFRIWKVARTPEDLNLFDKFPLLGNESGLLVYYRFIEGFGPIVHDFATDATTQLGSQDATIVNLPNWFAAGTSQALPMATASNRIPVGEDTARVMYLPAYDYEAWPLAAGAWSIPTPPAHGTLTAVTGVPGGYSYLPAANYNGLDQFTYRITANSVTADYTVYINVTPDNDPPVMSTIANQNFLESTTNTVLFTAQDNETAADQLQFTVTSSDQGVVPNAGLAVTSSGVNRVLTIKPTAGESGTTVITLRVTDTGAGSFPPLNVVQTFQVSFEPRPAFAIIDLGTLPTYNESEGVAINDKWEAVATATGNQQLTRGFMYPGPATVAPIREITPLANGVSTRPGALNNKSVFAFTSITSAGLGSVVTDDGLARVTLSPPPSTTTAFGSAFTDDGFVAGSALISGNWRAIRADSPSSTAVNLGVLSGHVASFGYGVNFSNHVVGVSSNANGNIRAFIHTGTMAALPTLPGGTNNTARAINNQGQIVGDSQTTLFDGMVADFAGGRYVQAPNGVWFNGGSFTVEAWVYPRSSSAHQRLIDFGTGTGVDNIVISIGNGPYFDVYNNVTPSHVAGTTLPLNQWSHIAAVFTGTTGIIYVNGVSAGSGAMAAPRNVVRTKNYIGKSNWAADPAANALIHGVRIWNVARSAAEVAADKEALEIADKTNLAVQYRLDEGSGSTARDTSGKGLDANYNGGAVFAGPTGLAYGPMGIRGALYTGTTVTSLGTLASGGNSFAFGINEFGKVVGSAISNAKSNATLYAAGTLQDVNTLLSEEDDNLWQLSDARSINRQGAIVGTGVKQGSKRAYLGLPATIVGRKVVRPQGAVTNFPPDIEIIDSKGFGDQPQQFFYWSAGESKLFATRPCIARLKWNISSVLTTNTDRIEVLTANIWPRTPTVQVVGAPVILEPAPTNSVFAYAYQQLHYPDEQTLDVIIDASTKSFTANKPGWSVIRYTRNNGASPDPIHQPAYFEVVRSYNYNDQVVYKDNVPWLVGDTIGNPKHFDYGRNGWVFFEKSFYDGDGPDRAYDRPTRKGPIIPVNTDTDNTDDLVVGWYKTNQIGVAWTSEAWRYSLSWPTTTTNKIIIASQLGTGALDPLTYVQPRIYNQPDKTRPGFNPNEEHAMMASSDTGTAMFALRNDLNALEGFSEPYSLLKYKDSLTGEWRIKVYKVLTEETPYFFNYKGFAGIEIQSPQPLRVLPICDETTYVSGPGWEDYHGKIYARAAGQYGEHANIVVRYFYPLQPDFYSPAKPGSSDHYAVGESMPWLDRMTGGTAGTPHDINFDIAWPDTAPVLNTGDSLLKAKNGLPDILDMASVKVIYDDQAENSGNAFQNLARLYDPLSPRTYKLLAAEKIPDAIVRQNINGKEYFSNLPWVIRTRLSYDPINRWITFQGYYQPDFDVGDPLMLPNVLTALERDRIKSLAAGDATWSTIVTKLYNLTRNPNQLDADWNGSADEALLVGLDYKTNTAIIPAIRVISILANTDSQIKNAQVITPRSYTLDPFNGSILSGVAVTYRKITAQQFGGITKGLTAGLSVPSASGRPGKALSYDGVNDTVTLTPGIDLSGKSFTVEFWVKRAQANRNDFIIGEGTGTADLGLHIGFRSGNQFTFAFWSDDLNTTMTFTDLGWHHFACVFDADTRTQSVYYDGRFLQSRVANSVFLGSGPMWIGSQWNTGSPLKGALDEVRVWSRVRNAAEIQRDLRKKLVGNETGLAVYLRFDEGSGTTVANAAAANAIGLPSSGLLGNGVAAAVPAWVDSDAPAAIPPRYLTVAENDDAALGALPVGLKVIRIDDGPFAGDLKVLLPDNVFDERLTLRQSPDFGGDPGTLNFEWYYQPAASGTPPALPDLNSDGTIANARGWIKYGTDPANGAGINQITIGEGGESSIVTLSDNWFISRYKGYTINSEVNWSDWIGDPASKSPRRPVLAEGWIKRVIRGLNPFDQRISDFRNNDVNTTVSMISQAGRRYEGDIAFNPSADAINGVGLIEAYETVLRRGKNLSMDGVPALNFAPANNAILLAATKVADLYTMLGNEAYADAQDPTIGFGTTSATGNTATYGSLASSIFAFQNQLDSLLEEELVLMRGRDNRAAGTQATPIYNRLFWNFTLGEGEVAYQQNYNVTDQNKDGFIDERDARIMYPQGHGDAWGHYLKALKVHYDLLRHPYFTWIPNTEAVNVAGAAIEVDFLDERKFARTAGLKAKAGAEIVDLTYRNSYVEDPNGQWQGYKDTDTDRAWGVTEWSRRAAQGAYFDWLTASTILPATDPNPAHTGIQKVDRTTVSELREIIWAHQDVQSKLDLADQGLNPLGLARGVVPFDIDPAQVSAGKTHFEQVADRAIKSMNNAIATWNEANQANELLRKNQDTLERFKANVQDQERDYKNRLIEIYGYPYAGEIGPGKVYPSGYDGPDIYHYMYVNTIDLNNDTAPPSSTFTNFVKQTNFGIKNTGDTKSGALGDSVQNFYFPEDYQGDISDRLKTNVMVVPMPYTTADWGFKAPTTWGQRRASGELQIALGEMLQNESRVKEANIAYDNVLKDIQGKMDIIDERYNLRATELKNNNDVTNVKISMGVTILALKATQKFLNGSISSLKQANQIMYEGTPKVIGLANDAFAPMRATLMSFLAVGTGAMEIGSAAAEAGIEGAKIGIEVAQGVATANIQKEAFQYDIEQQVRALEAIMREEAIKRVECYQMVQTFNQSLERYKQALAKGQRLIEERMAFRQRTAGDVSNRRYQDMTFRIFRNDALQKYRAQFDLAQRYVFLAATAYDYEVNLLGTDSRAGQTFLTDIIRQRALGQMRDGIPIAGPTGLADPLARLTENFGVLKTQLGFNNPQTETGRFSLRNEKFRMRNGSDADWRAELEKARVPNLWNVQEFRRFCRPFAPESAGPQPGLVISFTTAVRFGENFFGWPLSGGDSAYDPSRFATKIHSVGVWFKDYNGNGMSLTPRIYLVPVGVDVLRSPTGNDLSTRQWRILDQALPVPFTLGSSQLSAPDYIPMIGSLGGSFAEIRRFASFRGFHDSGTFSESEVISDSRLIGRSVWNSQWMLIIPGGTLLNNPNSGLDAFINSVSDIKLFFQTYSYSGN